MLKTWRANWAGAPAGLKAWSAAWVLLGIVSLVLIPKWTAVVRLGLTLVLIFHLLNKSAVARNFMIGACAFVGLLALSALRASPLFAGISLMSSAACIYYLTQAVAYKSWRVAASPPIDGVAESDALVATDRKVAAERDRG